MQSAFYKYEDKQPLYKILLHLKLQDSIYLATSLTL